MAYTCTPLSKELLAGTSNYRVIVEFASSTPATEPTFRKELTITPSMTLQECREWLFVVIRDAAPKKSVADLVVPGTPVTPLAPAAAPAATAQQIWQANYRKLAALKAMQALGITVADATIVTLTATVASTYVDGYL